MIKILLCCGGGFSSSYITEKLKKQILANKLENEVSIEYSPFSLGLKSAGDYDIMVCCPHLNISIKQAIKDDRAPIPIYILPPRMYGLMDIKEIYHDVKDLLVIHELTKINPVHFAGEENPLRITRTKAYNR